MKKTLISLSIAAVLGSLALPAAATSRMTAYQPGVADAQEKSVAIADPFQVAREASERPRGKDNERPGDRQRRGGRAALSADPVLDAFQVAREASERPRGKDNERPGDRQRRGGRA